MLPRSKRLIRALSAPQGPEKRLAGAFLSLSVRPSDGRGGCAAVVPKKLAPLAVMRHKLKRRILAVLAPWCLPTRIVIVYARAGIATASFADLQEDLTGLLVRAFGPLSR